MLTFVNARPWEIDGMVDEDGNINVAAANKDSVIYISKTLAVSVSK